MNRADGLRAAVYARVSSEDQAREGYSLDAQQRACAAYAAQRGWPVVGTYVDDGYTGRSLDRPAMTRLLGDAREQRFDVIVIWKIDRLSRRLRHLLDLYEMRLEPLGIGLASVTQAIDTTSPSGKAMFQVLGVFGELDWATMRERVALGRAEAARKGLSSGRTYGYRITGPGRREVDGDEAAVYRRIVDLFWSGHGTEMIAAILTKEGLRTPQYGVITHGRRTSSGKWNGTTILRILKSPVYAGFTLHRGQRFPGQHPPLIDPEEWERMQAELHGRATLQWRSNNGTFLLSGIAVCGICGARLYGTRRTSPKTGWHADYYCCSRRMRLKAADRLNNVTCALNMLRVERYEPPVLDALTRLMLDKDVLREAVARQIERETSRMSDVRRMREAAERELTDVQEKLRRLVAVAAAGGVGNVEEFAAEVQVLSKRRDEVRAGLAKMPSPPSPESVVETYLQTASSFGTIWEAADFGERRQILRALVRRVVMRPTPGDVDIELRLG